MRQLLLSALLALAIAPLAATTAWSNDDTRPPPDTDHGGGAAIFVSDSVIFQPRGIATALAIGAALVPAGVLLRRRHRRTSRRPTPQDDKSS